MMRWTKWSVIAGPRDAISKCGRVPIALTFGASLGYGFLPILPWQLATCREGNNISVGLRGGALQRDAWVSAGTARPVPEKGELLTCPAMADSHAELPPGSTWPHVTGHVGRADEALARLHRLAFGESASGSAPGWALVESWLARHNSLCWCWSGKDVKREHG